MKSIRLFIFNVPGQLLLLKSFPLYSVLQLYETLSSNPEGSNLGLRWTLEAILYTGILEFLGLIQIPRVSEAFLLNSTR